MRCIRWVAYAILIVLLTACSPLPQYAVLRIENDDSAGGIYKVKVDGTYIGRELDTAKSDNWYELSVVTGEHLISGTRYGWYEVVGYEWRAFGPYSIYVPAQGIAWACGLYDP